VPNSYQTAQPHDTMPDEEITKPHAEKHQPDSSLHQEPCADRPLVLIVETDPVVCKLMAYFLEEAGYVVNFANDGYTALDRIRLIQPTLLITGILLPHLDGLALCRLLKEDPVTSAVPIIVCTVLDSEARARKSGANAFIKKPIEKNRLLDIVRSLSTAKSAREDE
jgi:CheY-like chemotaxis protein